MNTPLKILFLCTTNSSRSVIAEFAARKLGNGRFLALSAGSDPKGRVHPLALRIIREDLGMDTYDVRSKSWEEYRDAKLDFVITLCSSASEACPHWPGPANRLAPTGIFRIQKPLRAVTLRNCSFFGWSPLRSSDGSIYFARCRWNT